MKYKLIIIAIMILCLGGCINVNPPKPIVVKRIDGKYGKDFYGVKLYPIKEGNHYLVKCDIEIGQSSDGILYAHNIGIIGKANSLQEIKDKYSLIEMKKNPNGEWLYVGDKQIISRQKLETHR